MNLADYIVLSTWCSIICLKVLEQIERAFLIQGKFIYIHLSDVQFIVALFSCQFVGFDCHVMVLAHGYWMLASLVQDSADVTCAAPAGWCDQPLPYPIHCLCAPAAYSFTSRSCPFLSRGLCSCCSFCLEYFSQDSLHPSFSPDFHVRSIIPMETLPDPSRTSIRFFWNFYDLYKPCTFSS